MNKRSLTAYGISAFAFLALASCNSPAANTAEKATSAASASIFTADVFAEAETAPVATANDDAADDPAIWRNSAEPDQSLIVGTDKKGGLYVYGLDGAVKSFTEAGRLNNVALLENIEIQGKRGILVAASDRADEKNAKIALFTLDGSTGKLAKIGSVPASAGEAYGLCLYQVKASDELYAFVVNKEGTIAQVKLSLKGPAAEGGVVRTMKLNSQSEGCVVNAETGTLYVGEEDVGVWKFDAGEKGPIEPQSVAKVDGQTLIADVEGLALARTGADGGYLVVSSQGDNAYAVFDLENEAFVGRFRIAPQEGGLDGTYETDGIELALGNFGTKFPNGLFIAQDGDNAPEAQNFKLVSWADVKAKLALK